MGLLESSALESPPNDGSLAGWSVGVGAEVVIAASLGEGVAPLSVLSLFCGGL
jgi:hypothetical protein